MKLSNVLFVAFPALAAASLRGENRKLRKDKPRNENAPAIAPAIKVTSGEGACYESVLLNELNFKGKFQPLDTTTSPPSTPYGPGDKEYVGGRWWVDSNGNGVMDPPGDDGDFYFLCPLTKEVECP